MGNKEKLIESQEDYYYHTKNSFEKELNITISSDIWNKLFFEVIDPYRQETVILQNKLNKLQEALKVIKEFTSS